ncbi:MAG: phasin family protein, partial [Gemmatimonadetes bacterium]|nr:phasin family protein [Gemmatimonadota bacterium]
MSKKTKKVQKDVVESASKIWLAGLGALSVAEEEGGKLFKTLVKKGEGFEKRGKKRLEKVQNTVEEKI